MNKMLLSHKIALEPNNKQATYFAKASGISRFSYNWGLSTWKKEYAAGGKPSETALRRQLNAIKREQFPWMLEVTKNAPQMAIINLGKAFKNFFSGKAKYPQFKKKGVHDSFQITNDQFELKGERIRIPLLGWVKMREGLRFEGKVLSATISRVADRWFVSIAVETPILPKVTKNQGTIGIDLGVKTFAMLSTGKEIVGPKPHRGLLNRLRRLSRSLSRKIKGSKNRKKAKDKLSRLHARIANIRQDCIHKLTSELAGNYSCIGIEDLNVKGMMSNRRLSRAIGDMGFFEFRRQLTYKSLINNVRLIVAPRWFASSKICSACDHQIKELSLAQRIWECPSCGKVHDRDLNSAINLEKMAASSAVTACGEEGAGRVKTYPVKPASIKQEANTEPTLE